MAKEDKYRAWQTFDRFFDRFAHIMVYAAAIALIACMLIAFIDVIIAKLFGSSIKYATEVITYLDVPIAYLGMGYTWSHGKMTTVDLMYGKLPRAVRKVTTLIFDMIGCGVCIFLAKLAFDGMIDYMNRGVMSNVREGFVVWPFYLLEFIGWVVLAVAFLATFVRLLLGITAVPGDEEDDLIPEGAAAGDQKEQGADAQAPAGSGKE